MTNLNLGGAVKTVATAGTAEGLIAAKTMVSSVVVRAEDDNTGNIFVGNSQVDNTEGPLGPGDTWKKTGDQINGTVTLFNLAQVFIDAAVNGEGVEFWYD